MIWDLPQDAAINGRTYKLRTDFRDILNILVAFDDPELEDAERQYICLYTIYPEFDEMPQSDYEAAYKAAIRFIDNGMERGGSTPGKRTMDWEQDAALIFPAVNRVAGTEVRALEYLHWYTFTGYFMEIKDSTFATILSLRQKKARGKKLEKTEREFWEHNKGLCILRPKETEEQKAEKDAEKAELLAILDGNR